MEKSVLFYPCLTLPSISKVTLDNRSDVMKFKISIQLWIFGRWLVFEVVTYLDNRRCQYYFNQNNQEQELCKVFNGRWHCPLLRNENVLLNLFLPNAPFLYPLKTSENFTVFLYFQGVEKECIGKNGEKKFGWGFMFHTVIILLSCYFYLWEKPLYRILHSQDSKVCNLKISGIKPLVEPRVH